MSVWDSPYIPRQLWSRQTAKQHDAMMRRIRRKRRRVAKQLPPLPEPKPFLRKTILRKNPDRDGLGRLADGDPKAATRGPQASSRPSSKSQGGMPAS